MVLGSLKLYESIEITSFFSLTHVHNYGAAFSFLADEDGWQQYFLVSISAIASIVIILWMSKTSTKQPYKLIALSLILSGAIGNLIDRAVFGFVIDFINLHYQDFYWPVFNVADIAITLGVMLLLLVDLKQEKSKS
jgi:signal peptidase II